MFVVAMFGFIGATFFHGGMVIGTFVFLFIILITSFKTAIKLFSQAILGVRTFIMLLITLIVFGYYFAGKINVPKVGQFISLSTFNKNILEYIGHNTSGEASFPEWIIPKNSIELVYKTPPKVAYFLFSPFPWDVKKTNQLIGMFDGFFYMYFTFLIFRNIKKVKYI